MHCLSPRLMAVELLACKVNVPHLFLLLCAGTELGGGYFAGTPLQPQSPSTFSTPTIGHRPVILRPLEQPEGAVALSPHGDVAGGWIGICCWLPRELARQLECASLPKQAGLRCPCHAPRSLPFLLCCAVLRVLCSRDW